MKDEKIMRYVPKRLKNAVSKAYRDSDGYWIFFKEGYEDTHMNSRTVHGYTIPEIIADMRNVENVKSDTDKMQKDGIKRMRKKMQKNFQYSSLKNKELIEAGVDAVAKIQHQTASYIIESALLEKLYPSETLKKIMDCAVRQNKNDDGSIDIKAMLHCACSCYETHNSIEIFRFIVKYSYLNCDEKSTFPNNKDELGRFYCRMLEVIHGMSESIENMRTTGYQDDLCKLNPDDRTLDKMIELMEKHSNDKYSVDVSVYEVYKSRFEYAKSLYERTKENPENVRILEYFELFLDFSNFIGDKDYAYKAVALLLELENLKMRKSCNAEQLYRDLLHIM